MRIIDADAHVEECAETWNYLDKSYYEYRPLPIAIDTDTPYGRNNAFWLIEGKVFPNLAGRGLHTFGTPPISEFAKREPVSIGAQTMTDIKGRLADMDRAMAFHSILSGGVLDEFPRLRLGFLEAGSQWPPYAIHQLERACHGEGKIPKTLSF